jgi:hypothetical protein
MQPDQQRHDRQIDGRATNGTAHRAAPNRTPNAHTRSASASRRFLSMTTRVLLPPQRTAVRPSAGPTDRHRGGIGPKYGGRVGLPYRRVRLPVGPVRAESNGATANRHRQSRTPAGTPIRHLTRRAQSGRPRMRRHRPHTDRTLAAVGNGGTGILR